MSTTHFTNTDKKPSGIYNDGTYLYVGTAAGKIYKITIADETTAVKAVLNEEITALVSDATNLYIGTAKGRLLQQVISTSVITTLEIFNSPILSLGLNSTNLYVGLAGGDVRYKNLA